MNHSEKILHLEEIEAVYIQRPVIPDIECLGIIEEIKVDWLHLYASSEILVASKTKVIRSSVLRCIV